MTGLSNIYRKRRPSEKSLMTKKQGIMKKFLVFVLSISIFTWAYKAFNQAPIYFNRDAPHDIEDAKHKGTGKSKLFRQHSCQSGPPSNTIIDRENLNLVDTKMTAFEVIVITHNRPQSLSRCMRSAQRAFYDKDTVRLSVWIDRFARDGSFNKDVVAIAKNFSWLHGEKVVHLWDRHVGLYGQWIDTFVPTSNYERAVILEDDLELSQYYYMWLKGASKAYSRRGDIFGYTLQRARLRADQRVLGKRNIMVDRSEKVFLYFLVGSWGYAPEPDSWRKFRAWFHTQICDLEFTPIVDGLIPSRWYRGQEKKKTMWTMWHIRYANDHKLYTVYANLDGSQTLAANWQEIGLHFSNKSLHLGEKDFDIFVGTDNSHEMFTFPTNPVLVDWNGTYVNQYGARLG